MNTSLNNSCTFYVATVNKQLAACFAVLHFPHPREKKFKKGHRLVVLPEFQGLGLGHAFSSEIAQFYIDQGYRFIITSNTKALYKQRERDKRWRITRIGRINSNDSRGHIGPQLAKTGSHNKITISYEYVGIK